MFVEIGCLIMKLIIPNGTKVVKEEKNKYKYDIESILIPSGVKSIEMSAFFHCENLKDVTIEGNDIEEIGDYAFAECYRLKEINFPNGLKSIGYAAFQKCKHIKNVILPDGLEIIDSCCFDRCTQLRTISIPNSIKYINGMNSFIECNKLEYNYYSGANYLGNKDNPYLVFMCNSQESFTPECFELKEIHKDCKVISSYAFHDYTKLINVRIPDGVTRIEKYTFNKPFGSVIFPKTICYINHFENFNYVGRGSIVYFEGTKNEWNKIEMNFDENEYNEMLNGIYFYSKENPKESGNYWHYDNGEPVKW